MTREETKISRTVKRTQDQAWSSDDALHSTTITTDIPPKFQIIGGPQPLHERYATEFTRDIPTQFQQVDLTIEVPIPPKFLQALKSITAMEGTKVTFEGVVTGESILNRVNSWKNPNSKISLY